MKKCMLLILSLSSFSLYSAAQDCTVSAEALQGKYEGACNKGKAEGKGTATGIDSYTGEFKKGYPDGVGKYTWKNGSWYEGAWKKGVQNGKGTMHHILNDGRDSTIAGFWKNGEHVGLYEKPYIVHYRTSSIHDIRVSKDKKSPIDELTLRLSNTMGNSVGLSSGVHPVIKLINFEVKSGFTSIMQKEESGNQRNFYFFRKLEFPFRIQLYFEKSGSIDIEFLEPGDWTVDVEIND